MNHELGTESVTYQHVERHSRTLQRLQNYLRERKKGLSKNKVFNRQ